MKLISPTQIAWSEPWFFLLRIRETRRWWQRLILALAVSALMFAVMHFFGGGQRAVVEVVGISLAAGFVLVLLLDTNKIQRDVTVKDDCIIVGTSMGRGWFHTIEFKDIQSIQLTRPEEWSRPYGAMVIDFGDEAFLVAVPNKVSLVTLANILNRLGVAVSLSGWEATDADTRIQVRDEVDLDPESAHGEVTLRPVDEQDGKLLSPLNIATQLAIALGPLLLAVIAGIAAGVHLYRNWADLSLPQITLIGGGALAFVVVSFLYLILIGQFVAAGWGIGVGLNRMQTRPNALFAGTETDLVAVEIFDRDVWTSVVAQSSDYGFLQVDRQQRCLRFEGNKLRWIVPAAALTTCRIEESLVGSEASPTEKRYFVVIAANNAGEEWEVGMVYVRTDIGNDTAERRQDRARLLFTQIAAIL